MVASGRGSWRQDKQVGNIDVKKGYVLLSNGMVLCLDLIGMALMMTVAVVCTRVKKTVEVE